MVDSAEHSTIGATIDKIDTLGLSTDQTVIFYNAPSIYPLSTTLRFMGTIMSPSVQVLLDGESTHKFIQSRVVHHLGLRLNIVTIL